MSDTIIELLKTPFAQLKYEDKLKIVQSERPQPALPELKNEHKEKNRSYTRCFNIATYKKFLWLAGSSELNKLYCWPCLLFSTDMSPWNTIGFSNLNYLITACDKHEKCLGHIKAFVALQTFGSERIDRCLNIQKRIEDSSHNEKVKENRTVLKRLIDAVVFLGKHECSFRSHGEPGDSRNSGMYIELLEFLAAYDPVLASRLKTGTIFEDTLYSIQNDLIDAVAGVITDKIKAEILEASFVAILLNETADVLNKSQLSTAVRYVDREGNCQERFLHFFDVNSNRTAQGLFQHITTIVDDLDCSEKLVAITIDGATVLADHVSDLHKLIKNKYPTASFIHSYSHRLNFILSQSTYYVKECRQFFTSLYGISNFFCHSTVHTHALESFMEKNFRGISPAWWNFSLRLVNTVKYYRQNLIQFFLSIEDEPGDWTTEEITAASGFIRFLSKFDTKFFLIVFYRIFAYSDVLFEALQNKSTDIFYCTNKVTEFYDTLQQIRNDDFEQVWREAGNPDDDDEPRSKRQRHDMEFYKKNFFEILDTIITQTKLRFESQKYLKFVSLMDFNRYTLFSKTFPEVLFSEFKEPYASYFDKVRLKHELKVFYSTDEYKNKSVEDITSYMKLNKLDIVFSEVYKLAELILTFPSTAATIENFSALKRIKKYLRTTQGQVHLSNLGILSIEEDVLMDFKKSFKEETFYENVTLKFTQQKQRMEFHYKH